MYKRVLKKFAAISLLLLCSGAYATEHCEFSNGTFLSPPTVAFSDFNLANTGGQGADPSGNRTCRYTSGVWTPVEEYAVTVLPNLGPGYSDRFYVADIGDDNGATSTYKATYVVRRYSFDVGADAPVLFDFVVEQIGTQRKMRIKRSIGSPLATTMDTLRLDAGKQLTLDYVAGGNANWLKLTVSDASGTVDGVYTLSVPTNTRLVKLTQGRISPAGTMSGNGFIDIWNY